ncbi:MAG TPA: amidohydrolase family protein [Stellaceae bacterium]|nr:amidohydrolase family protein [Stellaceae bacterium]
MDLVIRNARLSHAPEAGSVDIGVAGERIAVIAARLDAAAESVDAGGRLACAGLVETHIHLDKSRIIERCGPEEGRDVAAVKRIRPLKPAFTVEDVRARAERTLQQAILNGTTRMRTHVEVDPGVGMRGFEGVQSLIDDYRWAIDLELCVFPQEGLTNYPGTDALLVEGLKRGAKVIGAAPRYDTDHAGQITRIFELAREFDVDIDMHLDFGNTPEAPDIPLVLELTETYRRGGRVAVGHMTKLSTMPPAEVAALGRRLADAGIAVTVLPATDLFLMGRDQEHDVRRGLADANLLLEQGVNCSISSNNVLNPATPYGDCSLLRMANLHANVLQVSGRERLRECFHMISSRSARLLNHADYGLAAGNPADIVIIDAETPEQAVAEIRQPIAVFKRGRRTVSWPLPQLHRPG